VCAQAVTLGAKSGHLSVPNFADKPMDFAVSSSPRPAEIR
jgi:hypothetical protein